MTGNDTSGNDRKWYVRKWQEMTGNYTSGNVRKLWQKATSRMKLEKIISWRNTAFWKNSVASSSKWFLGPRERPRGQLSTHWTHPVIGLTLYGCFLSNYCTRLLVDITWHNENMIEKILKNIYFFSLYSIKSNPLILPSLFRQPVIINYQGRKNMMK